MAEVERVQRDGVRTAELDRAKRNLESEFIYQRETVQGQASQLGYFGAVLADLTLRRDISRRLPVQPQEISIVWRGRILRQRILPWGSSCHLPMGMHVTHERIVQTVQARTPTAETAAIAIHAARRDHTQKFLLDNGMTLLVRENPAVPLVAMQAVFLGGLWVEDAAHNGVMNFVAEMVTKGTAHRRARALAEEIESMAGDVSGFAGRSSFGVAAEVLASRFRAGAGTASRHST